MIIATKQHTSRPRSVGWRPAESSQTKRFYASRGIGGRMGFGVRPALLVVDFQRGMTDPASPLGARMDGEIEAARRLLAAARAARAPVHYTLVAYGAAEGDGGPFLRKMQGLALLKEGTWFVELDPRLERRPTETVWAKRGASAFFGTALAAALTAAGVDTLLISGCTTSGCVRASVIDSCQNGFNTIVVREAVADRAAGPHEANLFDMDAKYADVVSLDEALAALVAFGRSRTRATTALPRRVCR